MRSGFMSVQIVDGECEADRRRRRAERLIEPVVPSALSQLRSRCAVVDSEANARVIAAAFFEVVEMQLELGNCGGNRRETRRGLWRKWGDVLDRRRSGDELLR